MNIKLNRIAAVLLTLTMGMSLLAGCGVSDGGKKNAREINICIWGGVYSEDAIDKFEEDTGISVNITYITNDRYDIPAKAADHVRLGESEQMFEYLICAVCPVTGDYEAGSPECGFLFPSYAEGGALMNCIDIYQSDVSRPHRELEEMFL